MNWSFGKTRRYALTGDSKWSLLAEKISGPTGQLSLQTIACTEATLDNDTTFHQLFSGSGLKRGEVALTLPLNFFEVVSLAINRVPDEAVGRVLPFHLAKNLDVSLDDFIYDWLITKRAKETLQVSIFLFPKNAFAQMNATLAHYNMKCTSLEPDVVSAGIYLEESHRLRPQEATICALLWDSSLSVTVYDRDNLPLTRSLPLSQPQEPFLQNTPQPPSGPNPAAEPDGASPAAGHDILADFLVQTKENNQQEAPAQEPEEKLSLEQEPEAVASPLSAGWDNYCQLVSLEILRSRDYFNSIIKGNQINKVVLGGAELLWDQLSQEIGDNLDCPVEQIIDHDIALKASPTLTAMAIGALCR